MVALVALDCQCETCGKWEDLSAFSERELAFPAFGRQGTIPK